MLKHYLKVAFRNLWKYKIQNLLGISGLAMGFVVFSIACFVIKYVWNTDTQYENHDRMYLLKTNSFSTIEGDFATIFESFPDVEKYAYQSWPKEYKTRIEQDDEEKIYSLTFREVNPSFFDFFSLSFLHGNKVFETDSLNNIVIWESQAEKFGKPEELTGSTIVLNDESYIISGIVKDIEGNSSLNKSEGVIINKINSTFRNNLLWSPQRNGEYWVMLREGVSKEHFQKKLDDYEFNYKDVGDYKEKVFIEQINKKEQEEIFIFLSIFIIALLVLLTALFNYISFKVAQFYNRLKECAVRKVNGAGSLQQIFLFYTEVVLVFSIACFVGIILIDLLTPYFEQSQFNRILNSEIFAGSKIELIKYTFFGLIVSFFLCVIPALMIDKLSTRTFLLGLNKKGMKNKGRNILLFIQMVILLCFATSTLIINLQGEKVKSKIWNTLQDDEKKNIMTFAYHKDELPDLLDVIISKLSASSAIESVLFTNYPLSTYGSLFHLDTKEFGNIPVREYKVEENFCDFFHVKMRSGKFFNKDSSTDEMIIDETFLNSYFKDKDPVGTVFDNKTIIGVIENIQIVKETTTELTQELRPVFYTKADRNAKYGILYIKVFPGKYEEAKEFLYKTVREFIPDTVPIYISDFYDEINSVFENENAITLFTSVFFFFALVLCLLSIFSAVMMSVEKRKKEVAIRKINGASVRNIIVLFSRTYFIIWTLACLMVFPVVYYFGNQWVNTFSSRISLGFIFFISIYLAGFIFILCTILFRILKTARLNPAEVIKSE